jgi:hypothetical protein
LREDYSQAHNLAAKYPEKLKELQALFVEEAKRNQVFPLLPPFASQPSPSAGRVVFTYRQGVERLTGNVAPHLAGRPHRIVAEISIPEQGGNGVIIAQGSRFVGFTLFVKDRHVFYEVTANGRRAGRIVSQERLPAGVNHIELQVIPDPLPAGGDPAGVRPGKVLLSVNGRQQQEQFTNVMGTMGWETLDVGSDLGSAVILRNREGGTVERKYSKIWVDLCERLKEIQETGSASASRFHRSSQVLVGRKRERLKIISRCRFGMLAIAVLRQNSIRVRITTIPDR